jgi:ABC-type nitrate/sulfonate/bicarbonate transport system substrate-binding protein
LYLFATEIGTRYKPKLTNSNEERAIMRLIATVLATCILVSTGNVGAEPVRAAYPSANVQFLPAFVALEKGFYKREGLDAELISVRNAVTAVQALLGNQIHFIFSVGPQMPSIWEGSDIILLAQQVGRPTFSMIVTPAIQKVSDIQKVTDLRGKKIGVSFGGSTFAGTKALLELNKISDTWSATWPWMLINWSARR